MRARDPEAAPLRSPVAADDERPVRIVVHGTHHDVAGLREAVEKGREAGHRIEVRVTWEEGDATRYAAEAVETARVVVAGGGDGTVREVAAGLAGPVAGARAGRADGPPRAALAILPLGTANDFATAAGVPLNDIEAALRLALEGTAAPADVVRCGEHVYVNVATAGPATRITVETPDGLKRVLGGLSYALTGVVATATDSKALQPQAAHVRGPDFEWTGSLLALAVGNGRQAGGGVALCPEARIDDGLLDVRVVPEGSGAGAMLLESLLKGRETALDRASFEHLVPWVEVETEEPLPVNLDGEPIEGTSFRFEVDHEAIRVVVPADCPLLAPREG